MASHLVINQGDDGAVSSKNEASKLEDENDELTDDKCDDDDSIQDEGDNDNDRNSLDSDGDRSKISHPQSQLAIHLTDLVTSADKLFMTLSDLRKLIVSRTQLPWLKKLLGSEVHD